MQKWNKPKKAILSALIIVFTVAILISVFQKSNVYEVNAESFTKPFELFSFNQGEEIILDDLSEVIQFDWDRVLVFGPYVTEERMYEIVGYKWRNSILTGISEGMNQVIFMNDNEVVCHIQGYPDKYGVYFIINDYPCVESYADYCVIENTNELKCAISYKEGIYYLRLMGE